MPSEATAMDRTVIEDNGHFAIIRDGSGYRVVVGTLHSRLGTRLIRGPNRGDPPDLEGYRETLEGARKLAREWTHYTTKPVTKSRRSKRTEEAQRKYDEAMTGISQERTGFTT